MIKTLRLRNFKAFQDTGDIELKPITILAGPNSGGKSSVLQSLLLLKQTVEAESPEIDLNLDGRFLQFARFNELVFGRPRLQSSEVNYEIQIETRIPTDVIPRYFPNLAVPENVEQLPLQTDIEFSFRYKEVEEGKRQVVLNRFNMSSRVQNVAGPQLAIAFRNRGHRVKLVGVELPEPYQERAIRGIARSHFLPGFLLLESEAEKGKLKPSPPAVLLDPIFHNPLRDLEVELKYHLKYLGPLREEPRRAYLHSGSPYPEIGRRGEYAAQILWLEKDKTIEYWPSCEQDSEKCRMIDAIDDAFRHLGITQPIDVKSAKSIMYQILFGIPQIKGRNQVTIADVGFGVSQLLPVVVTGLRSPKQSLLLFEQPEIHLHPKLQANLADFFLTLALSGKRLLVETHSDYLINRLRRRIAEDPTDELREKVSILFVRPPHNGEGAIVEPLRVDTYGVIENWPPDFLPESADEAEAIFRAGLKKRQE